MASPPPKKQRIGEQQTHEWVKLQADNDEALVSLAKIKEHPDSVVATMVQLETEKHLEQRACLHGVGLVEYDGKLLAAGGCVAAWSGHHVDEEDEEDEFDGGTARLATAVVSSYDLRTDSWSELPARLPLPLTYACPVVANHARRMPGVQL